MDGKELLEKISNLTKEAETFRLKKKFKASVDKYFEALELLKEPKEESEYAMMLYSGIGEVYFLKQDYGKALEYYGKAVISKGGLGFPNIHLRLGQLRYEQGELEKAKDELMRAYMGSGNIIFEGQDTKYYELIKPYIEKK